MKKSKINFHVKRGSFRDNYPFSAILILVENMIDTATKFAWLEDNYSNMYFIYAGVFLTSKPE